MHCLSEFANIYIGSTLVLEVHLQIIFQNVFQCQMFTVSCNKQNINFYALKARGLKLNHLDRVTDIDMSVNYAIIGSHDGLAKLISEPMLAYCLLDPREQVSV